MLTFNFVKNDPLTVEVSRSGVLISMFSPVGMPAATIRAIVDSIAGDEKRNTKHISDLLEHGSMWTLKQARYLIPGDVVRVEGADGVVRENAVYARLKTQKRKVSVSVAGEIKYMVSGLDRLIAVRKRKEIPVLFTPGFVYEYRNEESNCIYNFIKARIDDITICKNTDGAWVVGLKDEDKSPRTDETILSALRDSNAAELLKFLEK